MDSVENIVRRDVESEIDLLQVLVDVLKNIKFILIFACVCALIFGGWKYAGGMSDMRRQSQVMNPDTDTDGIASAPEALAEDSVEWRQYKKAAEIYERQAASYEEQLRKTEEEISSREAYKRNSVLLNLDPQNFWQKDAVWYVDTHYQVNTSTTMQTPDPLIAIVSAYEALLTSADFYAYVQEHISRDVDARYIGELIFVNTDAGAALIRLTVIGDTEQMAGELYVAAEEYLELNYAQIRDAIDNYDITLVEEKSVSGVGVPEHAGTKEFMDSIIEAQNSFSNQLAALQNSATDLQLKLLSLEEPQEPEGMTSQASQVSQGTQGVVTPISTGEVLRNSIKYLVIGLLLGAVLACLYVVIVFITKDPAVSEEQLRKRYGLFVLSSLRRFDGAGWWQKMLSGLAGDARRVSTLEDAVALAQVNIESLLNATGRQGEKVLLIGRDVEQLAKIESLSENGKAVGLSAGGNIMTDKNAVEILRRYDNIVLVERKETTPYHEIGRELEKLLLLKKNVIGMIAL